MQYDSQVGSFQTDTYQMDTVVQAESFQQQNIVEELDAWFECDQRYSTVECPINEVLDLIGHKWTVQIIYYLDKERIVRFRQLHRLVAPITQKELTKRLRELEHAGLISRTVYAEVPPRVEYQLTKLGKTLVQPLAVLAQWAERNHDVVKSHQRKETAERETCVNLGNPL